MARPKKWGSAAERKAAYKHRQATKPDNVAFEGTKPPEGATKQGTKPDGMSPVHLFEPDGRFAGHGRGVPVDGMVLVSVGPGADKMVGEGRWRRRLQERCPHGWEGWTCKACLGGEDGTLRSVGPGYVDGVVEKHFGPKVKTEETFTLTDGREVPVYRRVKADGVTP